MDGRPPGRVEPWLATICLNLGRDRARRAATQLEVTSDTLADHPDGTDVAAEAIHRVQGTQVERALWALPEPQRVAVTLMDLGGFTAAEVAPCWAARGDGAGLGPPRPQGAGPSGPRTAGGPRAP